MNRHTFGPHGFCLKCGHWKDDPQSECPLTDEQYRFAVDVHPSLLHQMRGYNRSYHTALQYLLDQYEERFKPKDSHE